MTVALTWVNLALRRLMQLGVVLAVGYWSYHASQRALAKAALGVLAPVLVFGFWDMVDFHRAGRMAEPLRLLQELLISGLAAVALVVAGLPALGWALALTSIAHHALVYALGERLLKE
jgi:hypothetical protein